MQTKIEKNARGAKKREEGEVPRTQIVGDQRGGEIRRGSATDANRWRSKGRRDVRWQERGRHHVREQVVIVEEMLMRLAETAWRMPP